MLLQNIRAKIGARLKGDSEAGFTLIELLVVMLILGILAAIALPAFFNQKDKAGDAKAKENLHSMQVAMETCASDNGGVYDETNCDQAGLNGIEPSISATSETIEVEPEETGYTLEADGSSENTFTIKNTEGELEFTCTTENTGGCGDEGKWGE